jgi:sugar phosphate isomerase/epimerase
MGPIDPKALKEIADREGLSICATHISFESMRNNIEGVIADHKLWNCKYVGVGGLPHENRGSKQGFVDFAKEASKIARKLADNGLQFIYHNHNFEFRKFGGMTGLEILYNECDRSVFDFEIDTYWVQAGASDPTAWIRKVGGNMKVVHLKDMAINDKSEQIMAEVGEGNLNWPAIIDACKDIGVEWYVVEQDTCQRDPFESLKISLENLHRMGLK